MYGETQDMIFIAVHEIRVYVIKTTHNSNKDNNKNNNNDNNNNHIKILLHDQS